MTDKHIGFTIKMLREALHMSLRELARQTEISPSLIMNIEHGNVKEPGFGKIQAIAKVLNISIDDLADGRIGVAVCPTCDGKGWIKE